MPPWMRLPGYGGWRTSATPVEHRAPPYVLRLVQWRDCSSPHVVIVPRSDAGNSRAPVGPVSPCHPEWAATSMNMPIFSYVKKLYGNFYLALYTLLLQFILQTFYYLHIPALLCPAAPASVCGSHSLTGTLEVPADSQGACEFYFGQQPVLLDGQPVARPVLGRARAHIPLSLVLNPEHVYSALLTPAGAC
jgi:hypothetical protein